MTKPRVRFAPSPTGPLHLGGIRTAIYNYLYARANGGTFILRIEDTDRSRLHPQSEKHIIDTLHWLGINPDEGPHIGGKYGPYRQSDRLDIYLEFINRLLKDGKAYLAFDTHSELNRLRKKNKSFLYSKHNRNNLANSLNPDSPYYQFRNIDSISKLERTDFVVRLKVDQPTPLVVEDFLRGKVTFAPTTLEDKILLKRDRWPTYHFADIVDDYLMKTTHIIRGEEWLPSLSVHHLIYQAFGWKPPCFLHLPLLLGPDKKGKLSKRDAAIYGYPIFALQWDDTKGYKELGYLPEGLINYLSQLGWSPPNVSQRKEVFNLGYLVSNFTLAGLQKKSAVVDFEKLKWTNQQHLSNMESAEIIDEFRPFLQDLFKVYSQKEVEGIIDIIKPRCSSASDLTQEAKMFLNVPDIDLSIARKVYSDHWTEILDFFELQISDNEDRTKIKTILFAWGKSNGIPIKSIMQTLRIALVGKLIGPDLFNIINFVGVGSLNERVRNAKAITPKIM